MIQLIIFFFTAIVVSFICSILEAALLSISQSFIDSKIAENKKYAISLKKYKSNIDLPLSAILTLNTMTNTIGAVGVGAQAQKLWGNEYLTITSASLTFSILIFSEIIPKTLGASYWKTLAPVTSQFLTMIIYSPLYPLIILAKFISNVLNKSKNKQVLSRSEFMAIANIGIKDGVIKEEESKILMHFIKFNSIIVRNIMTPRTVVFTTQEDMLIQDLFEKNDLIRFSRIPIYKNDIDNITGYILKDEIMQNLIQKNNVPVSSLKREIKVVNEQMPIIRLFYQLIEDKEHIAMVVGEYGEFTGIITMEDIIETFLGTEIIDELDSVEDMQDQARQMWEKRAKRLGLIK